MQKAPTPVVVMMTTMMRMMKVAQLVMVEVSQVAMMIVAGQKKHFADQSALWIDDHGRCTANPYTSCFIFCESVPT
jgi:hypothetical protein